MHRIMLLHCVTSQTGGELLSMGGGVAEHVPWEQDWAVVAQSWHGAPPVPQVAVDSPPAQKPLSLQQPPQVFEVQGGPVSTTATSGAPMSSRASTPDASTGSFASLASLLSLPSLRSSSPASSAASDRSDSPPV
jgi:hypothetical protein